MSARAGRPEASRVGARPRSLCDARDLAASPTVCCGLPRGTGGQHRRGEEQRDRREGLQVGEDQGRVRILLGLRRPAGEAGHGRGERSSSSSSPPFHGRARRRFRGSWCPAPPAGLQQRHARRATRQRIDTAASPKDDPIRHAPRTIECSSASVCPSTLARLATRGPSAASAHFTARIYAHFTDRSAIVQFSGPLASARARPPTVVEPLSPSRPTEVRSHPSAHHSPSDHPPPAACPHAARHSNPSIDHGASTTTARARARARGVCSGGHAAASIPTTASSHQPRPPHRRPPRRGARARTARAGRRLPAVDRQHGRGPPIDAPPAVRELAQPAGGEEAAGRRVQVPDGDGGRRVQPRHAPGGALPRAEHGGGRAGRALHGASDDICARGFFC